MGQVLKDTGAPYETGLRQDSGEPSDSSTPDSAEPVDTGPEPVTDADGDGYDSLAAGGTDCNDQNDQIHPYAGDSTDDWEDSDCDGLDCQAGATADGSYFVVCPQEQNWEEAANTCLEAGYEGLALIENSAVPHADQQGGGTTCLAPLVITFGAPNA